MDNQVAQSNGKKCLHNPTCGIFKNGNCDGLKHKCPSKEKDGSLSIEEADLKFGVKHGEMAVCRKAGICKDKECHHATPHKYIARDDFCRMVVSKGCPKNYFEDAWCISVKDVAMKENKPMKVKKTNILVLLKALKTKKADAKKVYEQQQKLGSEAVKLHDEIIAMENEAKNFITSI